MNQSYFLQEPSERDQRAVAPSEQENPRSVREHSQNVFPDNVTCMTAYSLAYDRVVNRMGYSSGNNVFMRSSVILKTIEDFCKSNVPALTMSNVPRLWTNSKGGVQTLDTAYRATILSDAKSIWNEGVKNPKPVRSPSIPIYARGPAPSEQKTKHQFKRKSNTPVDDSTPPQGKRTRKAPPNTIAEDVGENVPHTPPEE